MQKKPDLSVVVMILATVCLVATMVVAFIQMQNDKLQGDESKCACECVKASEATEANIPTDNTVSQSEETVEIKEIIKEVPVYVEVKSPDEEYYKAYHRAFHELLTGWTGVDEYGREVILANANSDIEKTAFCDAINDFNGIAEQAWSDGAEQGAYEATNLIN